MLAKTEAPKVVLATAADENEVMAICRLLHAENGMANMDDSKVRGMLYRAFDRQGGIIGVIRGPERIEAAIYLLLTEQWYTTESHLEELFSIVHPEHRKSNHITTLIDFAKSMSDLLSKQAGFKIPLMLGVLTNERMAGKVRLYRRSLGWPTGAIFAYNVNWINDPVGGEFWKEPFPEQVLQRSDNSRKRHNAKRTQAYKDKKESA